MDSSTGVSARKLNHLCCFLDYRRLEPVAHDAVKLVKGREPWVVSMLLKESAPSTVNTGTVPLQARGSITRAKVENFG